MKSILIGILAIGAISAHAEECVESIWNGKLCITEKQIFADGSAKIKNPNYISPKLYSAKPAFDVFRIRSNSRNAEHVCQAFGYRQSIEFKVSRKSRTRIDLVEGRYKFTYSNRKGRTVKSIDEVICL